MPEAVPVGTTRVAQNGYTWIKTDEGWRYLHHVIAEQKLGRRLARHERVKFIDGDRYNLVAGNLEVFQSDKSMMREQNKVFLLQQQVDQMLEELTDIKARLAKMADEESS